ncbi:MAG: WYL domain-containing protein [Flavobacterium sp.]|nr:MAG: WYL domain-containing protein [Flavobacterium sp.]
MPDNKNFAYRIEIIDECLRNRFRKWTLQNLIDAVNDKLMERYGKTAGKRTIQDDLKFMKEEKEAPIEKRKDGAITYFFYSDVNYSLKNLPIKDEEIGFLNDAINILRQVNDFKLIQDVDEIVNKLQNTVNTNIENGPSIIQFEKHTTAIGTEYIDDIFSAIKDKCALRITYQSFNANESMQFIFHPYLLKEYRNRWFVIGRQEASNKITNLALDRIKAIKNSNSQYVPNDLFDPETYFNNLIGVSMPEGETIQQIDIRVAAKQAPYIRTKPIHHTQEVIKEYAKGDILIRVWLINNYELRSVLQSFGCDLEVLKPASLRESLIETFQNAMECYR